MHPGSGFGPSNPRPFLAVFHCRLPACAVLFTPAFGTGGSHPWPTLQLLRPPHSPVWTRTWIVCTQERLCILTTLHAAGFFSKGSLCAHRHSRERDCRLHPCVRVPVRFWRTEVYGGRSRDSHLRAGLGSGDGHSGAHHPLGVKAQGLTCPLWASWWSGSSPSGCRATLLRAEATVKSLISAVSATSPPQLWNRGWSPWGGVLSGPTTP